MPISWLRFDFRNITTASFLIEFAKYSAAYRINLSNTGWIAFQSWCCTRGWPCSASITRTYSKNTTAMCTRFREFTTASHPSGYSRPWIRRLAGDFQADLWLPDTATILKTVRLLRSTPTVVYKNTAGDRGVKSAATLVHQPMTLLPTTKSLSKMRAWLQTTSVQDQPHQRK